MAIHVNSDGTQFDYHDTCTIHSNAYVHPSVRMDSYCNIGEAKIYENVTLHYGCQVSHGSIIRSNAWIRSKVEIGKCSTIGSDARIGMECILGSHVNIWERADVGMQCILGRHVTVQPDVQIGNRLVIPKFFNVMASTDYFFTITRGDYRICAYADRVKIGCTDMAAQRWLVLAEDGDYVEFNNYGEDAWEFFKDHGAFLQDLIVPMMQTMGYLKTPKTAETS